jgi:hypothetical protein
MSKEKIVLCEDLADVMPPEYQELVEQLLLVTRIVVGRILVLPKS